MSEHNIELLRQILDAYNANDIEALIACCDPQVELHSAFAAVGGAVYHGHDGLRKWDRDLEDEWGHEIRVEPEAFFDLGEQTLAFYVLHGRGPQSGADVAMPVALVVRWRDDLAVYFKAYAHKDDAFADLGVAEGALEPIAP